MILVRIQLETFCNASGQNHCLIWLFKTPPLCKRYIANESSAVPWQLMMEEICFVFDCDSLHARLKSHQEAWSYQKKKTKNIKESQKQSKDKRCILTLELKTIQIIGQRKVFCRQIIPESSCAMKDSVGIDTLATSKIGDRKIMQSRRITSKPPTRLRK